MPQHAHDKFKTLSIIVLMHTGDELFNEIKTNIEKEIYKKKKKTLVSRTRKCWLFSFIKFKTLNECGDFCKRIIKSIENKKKKK